MVVISEIAFLLLLVACVVAAIRFWHKRITRVVVVVVAIGLAWPVCYLIALSSVKCLGSCG